MGHIEQIFANSWTPVATILVFLALAGWGMTIARCLRFRYPPDMGLSAAFGLAFSVVMGGVLNRFGLISLPFVRVYLMLGFLLCLATVIEHRQNLLAGFARFRRMLRDPFLLVGMGVIACLVLLKLFESGVCDFNVHDDYQSYLVYPVKMLQTGSLGEDPFNMGQLVSSLGGQSFLLTLMLGVLDLNRLNSLESGVGFLMGMALVIGHVMQRQSPARMLIMVLLLWFTSWTWPSPYVNVSSVLTGVALFYALMRTFLLEEKDCSAWGRVVLLSLLVAGLCALKTTHVPAVALWLLALYAVSGTPVLWKRIKELALVGVIACAFLMPWMIDMYYSGGTLFYPFFGKGYYNSRVLFPHLGMSAGRIFDSIVSMVNSTHFLAGLILIVLPFSQARTMARGWRCGVAVLIASWCVALLILIAVPNLHRYYFACLFSSMLFLLSESLETPLSPVAGGSRWRNSAVAAVVALAVMLGASWSGLFKFKDIAFWLQSPMRAPVDLESGTLATRAAQNSIPPGVRFLVRTSKPYQFDFRRNPIYVVDWYGPSPPPGMPYTGSAEDLARYLRAQQVRYVIYSYKDEAGFPYNVFKTRLQWPTLGVGIVAKHIFAFQTRLDEIGRLYRRIYDDGNSFVLDLNQRTTSG